MNNEPIDVDTFNAVIDSLDKEEREHFRECVTAMLRCFMQNTDSLGVFVALEG